MTWPWPTDRTWTASADLFWRGSDEALAGLGRDECDIVGFHVPEAWAVDQLVGSLGRWLKPSVHVCLPLMRRCQGLIVARGNPHRLASLADVSRRGLRMVNRQRGSGTRSLIDQLLAANGLQPESMDGYAHEEFTHEAIAETVAAGQADVGFGIEAAAMRYDLGFVPLVWEHYGFVMRKTTAASVEGKALSRLPGNTFRQPDSDARLRAAAAMRRAGNSSPRSSPPATRAADCAPRSSKRTRRASLMRVQITEAFLGDGGEHRVGHVVRAQAAGFQRMAMRASWRATTRRRPKWRRSGRDGCAGRR